MNIPTPTKTVIKDWEGAWYWLESKSPFSNKYIDIWATKPLVGEDVGLASDAYVLQRTGWSEAAILSSIHLLKRQYDMHEFQASEEDLENSEIENEDTVNHSNEKERKDNFPDASEDDLENSEIDNEDTVNHLNKRESKENFPDWYDDWSD